MKKYPRNQPRNPSCEVIRTNKSFYHFEQTVELTDCMKRRDPRGRAPPARDHGRGAERGPGGPARHHPSARQRPAAPPDAGRQVDRRRLYRRVLHRVPRRARVRVRGPRPRPRPRARHRGRPVQLQCNLEVKTQRLLTFSGTSLLKIRGLAGWSADFMGLNL